MLIDPRKDELWRDPYAVEEAAGEIEQVRQNVQREAIKYARRVLVVSVMEYKDATEHLMWLTTPEDMNHGRRYRDVCHDQMLHAAREFVATVDEAEES